MTAPYYDIDDVPHRVRLPQRNGWALLATQIIGPDVDQALDVWWGPGRALCAETDPNLFFPEKGDWTSAHQAQATCAHCEIRAQCGQRALDTGEHYGIWGGETERQRRKRRWSPP